MGATAATLFVDAGSVGRVRIGDDRHRSASPCTRPAQNSLDPCAHGDAGRPHRHERRDGHRRRGGEDAPVRSRPAWSSAFRGPALCSPSSRSVTLLGAVFVSRVQGRRFPPSRLRGGSGQSDVWHETLAGFTTLRRAREPRLVVRFCSPPATSSSGALDVLFVANGDRDLLGIAASGAGYLGAGVRCAGALIGAAMTVVLVGRKRLTPRWPRERWLRVPIGLVAVTPSAVSAPITVRGRRRWAHARGRCGPHAAPGISTSEVALSRGVQGARGTSA